MRNDIIDRLKAAVAKSGQSPRSISLKAGMSDGAIRGIFKNPGSSPTVETIENLAKALQISPEWLAFGVDGSGYVEATETESIPIRGEVAAGQWLNVEFLPTPDEMERAPLGYTPEWPKDAQYCLRVKGTSINRRAADGDLLRCLDIGKTGLEPRPGDLVIVQRTRFDGEEVEVTAKLLKVDGYITTLEPDSTDDRHQPIILDARKPQEGVTVTIIAVVDLVLKPMRRWK